MPRYFHYCLLPAAVLMAAMPAVAAAAAATSPPPAAPVCTACHGAQGQGSGAYPRIAGQPAEFLQQELRYFRSGARPSPVMHPVTRSLSDADIAALAGYFSTLHPPFAQTPSVLSAAELARGEKLVTVGDWPHGVPACVRCHGPDLGGVAPLIPALAGQSRGYMITTLQLMQGARTPAGNVPLAIMSRISQGLSAADIQAVSAYIAALKSGERPRVVRPPHAADYEFTTQSPDHFRPPPDTAVPEGPEGAAIWRGRLIFEYTRQYAPAYVGNALNCSSCHLDRGRLANSAPMWAAYVAYPRYRSKNRRVNTLVDRIQDCFRYSLNGKPPPADSPTMVALLSYFHWLATGLPVGITPKGAGYPPLPAPGAPPSIERGAAVYAANCALCHGDHGEGRSVRSTWVFPPLWGPDSFNAGAGMERIGTAADFIRANMPYGAGGTLSIQQAWDVAAFVVSHPRPQDPRFAHSVAETRAKYHRSDSYYGRVVNGKLLGAAPKPDP